MHNGIDPHFIGGNRIQDKAAIVSAVDRLCDLDDGLHVAAGQARLMGAHDLNLCAGAKKNRTTNRELPHRPNENKISYGFRHRGLIEVKIIWS